MAPKISIIIPVYNAEAYLNQTLTTILKQSLKEIEVICVDDGSTDNSRSIIEKYAERDERVKLLTQQNQYAGVARNNGLKVAQGEYVHFMDADDYVLNYAYEAIYHKAVKMDLDCLKFMGIAYDEELKTTVENNDYSLNKLTPGDFHRLLAISDSDARFKLCVTPWTGIYRRSFLLENNITFNNLRCVNDRSFFMHVMTTAPRVAACRDRLVVHRVNMSGSLVGQRAIHFQCQMDSFKIIEKQLLEDNVDRDIFKRIIRSELNDIVYWCKRLCIDETYGEKVVADTVEFFKGLNYYFIDDQRRNLNNLISDKEAGKIEPVADNTEKIKDVFFEKCESPKVSVIVPVYNQEDYLNHALQCLTYQTMKDMEFICVNDGSTDESMAIMKEYATVDRRIRIITKKNTGYGHSMNVGIDAARGEYIGILEPDDYVPYDMFETLYELAHVSNLDLVKSDFSRFWIRENGKMDKKLVRLSNDKTYYGRVINPSEETEVFGFMMNTWTGIYNRDFLNKWHIRHHESPGASYQDIGFWFQTFMRAERIMFCDKPMYMYRRDNPNASMFSKGKFYAHTEEYKFLWNIISKEPKLVKKYEKIFYFKKFNSFSMTYYRLEESLKRDYLHHICDEFREPMAQGKMDEELLGPRLWMMLNEIREDPDAYYEKIRVSVIVPAYNAAPFIRECLDSLLTREEIKAEFICVDDGSEDETFEILKEYEAKDSRVKAIHQENAGAGAARNTGMQYAKGEYLAFLDADDFFDTEMLRRSYEKAHTENSDILVFRSDQYFVEKQSYEPAQFTVKDKLLPAERPFAGSDIPKDIFRAFVGWPWDKIFKADFVRENNLQFQVQRTTNDMLFVFSAIVKAERISLLDMVLAHHRRVDDGRSLSVSRELSWHCFYDALVALRTQLKEWGLFERYERDFIDYALHFSLWNLNTIKGESYYKLFDKLKNEWFDDLGITGKDVLYFTDESEYDQLVNIMAMDADEYLFYRMDVQVDEANKAKKSAVGKVQRENDNLKNERLDLWATKRERGIKIKKLEADKQAQKEEIERQRREIEALKKGSFYWIEERVERKIRAGAKFAYRGAKKVYHMLKRR